ncbi:MAG: (Fe-S)-binding protein [Chloroflexi bacterium]|nr:(Fe-S)-binding protein [Chloroflexota bacterium]
MSKGTKGLIPPGLAYIADNFTSKGNILGASKGSGAKWAKDLSLPKRSETIFFAGCGYQYSAELEALSSLIRGMDKSRIGAESSMGIATLGKKLGVDLGGVYRRVAVRGSSSDAQPLVDAVRVLGKLGVQFGYLAEDEPCCAGLLHYVGLEKEFSQNAESLYSRLKSLGVKRIIGIVPSCTYTLRTLVPHSAPGYDIEVRHFSEVVLGKINSVELRFPKEAKVVYHDPCQLARYLGLTEEPRQILRAIKGIALVETEWTHGEWATCCGGGGGFEAVFPELSQILAVNRTRELLETGAKMIVTHCPGCILQLRAGLKELKAEDVEVLDLAQVISMSM